MQISCLGVVLAVGHFLFSEFFSGTKEVSLNLITMLVINVNKMACHAVESQERFSFERMAETIALEAKLIHTMAGKAFPGYRG